MFLLEQERVYVGCVRTFRPLVAEPSVPPQWSQCTDDVTDKTV